MCEGKGMKETIIEKSTQCGCSEMQLQFSRSYIKFMKMRQKELKQYSRNRKIKNFFEELFRHKPKSTFKVFQWKWIWYEIPENPKPIKQYSYFCKTCFNSWVSEKNYNYCPNCLSKNFIKEVIK